MKSFFGCSFYKLSFLFRLKFTMVTRKEASLSDEDLAVLTCQAQLQTQPPRQHQQPPEPRPQGKAVRRQQAKAPRRSSSIEIWRTLYVTSAEKKDTLPTGVQKVTWPSSAFKATNITSRHSSNRCSSNRIKIRNESTDFSLCVFSLYLHATK